MYAASLLLILLIGIGSDFAEAATTLDEAFQSALKQSETFASQGKLVEEAEARYSQARGSILPNLSASASYTVQDRPTDALAEAFFPRTQPEVKLTLRQPIFRGLREFAALRQFSHFGEAERHAREQATLLLYNDVARSYHAVLAAEEDLKNITKQLTLYDDRIGELNLRVRAGTSSESDSLALRASRGTVRSQLEISQAVVKATREAFAFVTGLARETELASLPREQPKAKAVEEYLETIEKRPDVLAMVERTQAAGEQVNIAKGAHLPTVDLLGNYYFKRQSEVYQGIDWDIQLAASLPLYSGGTITAQAKESLLQRERAELDLARLRRQAQQQVRTLHSDYLAGLGSIMALEQSLQLAEKNYVNLKSEFRRGLTRNLDVLQALITSHEVRRSLVRARFAARDTWVQLNTAAGSKPSL